MDRSDNDLPRGGEGVGHGSESDEPISPDLDELFGALSEDDQAPNIGDLPSANSSSRTHPLPSASSPLTAPAAPAADAVTPRSAQHTSEPARSAPEDIVYVPDDELTGAELPSAAPAATPAAEQQAPAFDYASLAAQAQVSAQPLNAAEANLSLIEGEELDAEPAESASLVATNSEPHSAERRRASRNESSQSTQKAPALDPFDTPQMGKRVGVHRAPRRRGPNWIFVMWAALLTLLLVVAGIVYIVIGVGNVKLPNPLQSSATGGQTVATEVEPVVNPAATVTILNGTADAELGASASAYITDQQLGVIGNESTTETPDITISAVFYADPADEAAALGLAAKLGGMQAHLTDSYVGLGTQLVVLIGTDLALPDPAQ